MIGETEPSSGPTHANSFAFQPGVARIQSPTLPLISSMTWSGYDVENLRFKIFPTSYRDHEFQRVEGMRSTAQYICKGT